MIEAMAQDRKDLSKPAQSRILEPQLPYLEMNDINLGDTDVVSAIERDLERTFSSFPYVAERHSVTLRLLAEYALYDEAVGYAQGMNYVAAALMARHDDEVTAKAAFVRVLSHLRGFWMQGFPLLHTAVRVFVPIWEDELPLTFRHFKAARLEPLDFLPTGWLALFAKWIPLPAMVAVLDFIEEDGLAAVLAITLSLFEAQQHTLLRLDGLDSLLQYLNHEMRSQPISGELLERRSRKQWLASVKRALGSSA